LHHKAAAEFLRLLSFVSKWNRSLRSGVQDMNLKGDSMTRLAFPLTIPVLAALLVGCASNVVAQSNEVMPTSVPEMVQPTASPEVVSKDPPADCPITVPPAPEFVPPVGPSSPQPSLPNEFWFGSKDLWTSIPTHAVWSSLPLNPEGYTQKVFWWREGYVWDKEPEPNLIVTGERLDAAAPRLRVSRATNAYASDIGSAMLVGVDFPALGCWKITGKYNDSELSFVIWIAP
jgi:hypothetical protein